jgi:circadian clock protein KaiC
MTEGMTDPRRLHRAFAALMNELRYRGVTTMFTEETELFPIEVATPVSDHSAITDNIVYMRHVDLESNLVRFISVLKTRDSRKAKAIHQFEISESGIDVDGVFHGVEAIFTGTPKVSHKSGDQVRRPMKKGSTKRKR